MSLLKYIIILTVMSPFLYAIYKMIASVFAGLKEAKQEIEEKEKDRS